MKKYKLIGSAPNLDILLKGISKYYCGELITLEPDDGFLKVLNSRGILQQVRVIKKKNRYRFERIDLSELYCGVCEKPLTNIRCYDCEPFP